MAYTASGRVAYKLGEAGVWQGYRAIARKGFLTADHGSHGLSHNMESYRWTSDVVQTPNREAGPHPGCDRSRVPYQMTRLASPVAETQNERVACITAVRDELRVLLAEKKPKEGSPPMQHTPGLPQKLYVGLQPRICNVPAISPSRQQHCSISARPTMGTELFETSKRPSKGLDTHETVL